MIQAERTYRERFCWNWLTAKLINSDRKVVSLAWGRPEDSTERRNEAEEHRILRTKHPALWGRIVPASHKQTRLSSWKSFDMKDSLAPNKCDFWNLDFQPSKDNAPEKNESKGKEAKTTSWWGMLSANQAHKGPREEARSEFCSWKTALFWAIVCGSCSFWNPGGSFSPTCWLLIPLHETLVIGEC